VKLEFTPDAIGEVAKKAVERKTGARGLRSIMEDVMMDMMYEIPSDPNIGICTINRDTIDKKAKPEVVYRDATVTKKPVRKMKENAGNAGEIA
jgi:ATP-dependent Clp protease ATP-binding subunit ClpX